MTEADWDSCGDPGPMLDFLRGALAPREARLFACGCCRAVLDLVPDRRCLAALRKLEAYADDIENEKLRRDASNAAGSAYRDLQRLGPGPAVSAACAVLCAAERIVPVNLFGNVEAALTVGAAMDHRAVLALQADLLRDVAGNPFHVRASAPPPLAPAVVALAGDIYADRAFDRLPRLADALRDAGSAEGHLMDHCRRPGRHVRGCWAVDAILGKR